MLSERSPTTKKNRRFSAHARQRGRPPEFKKFSGFLPENPLMNRHHSDWQTRIPVL